VLDSLDKVFFVLSNVYIFNMTLVKVASAVVFQRAFYIYIRVFANGRKLKCHKHLL
jgi:hypothetical protein